jgi:hypothetical protein
VQWLADETCFLSPPYLFLPYQMKGCAFAAQSAEIGFISRLDRELSAAALTRDEILALRRAAAGIGGIRAPDYATAKQAVATLATAYPRLGRHLESEGPEFDPFEACWVLAELVFDERYHDSDDDRAALFGAVEDVLLEGLAASRELIVLGVISSLYEAAGVRAASDSLWEGHLGSRTKAVVDLMSNPELEYAAPGGVASYVETGRLPV